MKKLGFLVLTFTLLVPSLAFADSEGGIRGGWVEGEGYWVESSDITLFSSPDSHTGWKQVNSDETKYRAVGVTTWKGKRHYTRARMQGHVTGKVYADSGRVWGTDSTEAKSPWTSRNARAITNWGT